MTGEWGLTLCRLKDACEDDNEEHGAQWPAWRRTDWASGSTELFVDTMVETPEQFLGYPIGSRYTRHDQLVAYFQELASRSDKISVREIGRSYESRPLLIATVTAAGNHARLEQLRQQHATLADPAQPLKPLVRG